MTPRSSCPGGESTPLQGANLRLNYEINNVTDTALGNLAGATIILAGISRGPQLQTAWVTFGKQRRYAESRNMRSARLHHRGRSRARVLAPHILWRSEGSQEFIDRAEVAPAKMRVDHRFDGFQLLGWVRLQIHFRGLHLRVPEP